MLAPVELGEDAKLTIFHCLTLTFPGSSQRCPISRVKIWTGRALGL